MAPETELIQVGVLLGAVAIGGVLARYLRQAVIPFYILAGMLLGEFGLGRLDLPALLGTDLVPHGRALMIPETDFIALGAEIGIVLLLFFLGLEFNIDRLLDSRRQIGGAGTVDLLVNGPVGFALGWALFGAVVPAFLVAGIVYISSSAIITKALIDLGWIANDEAEPMLGTLVYEDLVIAVYLAVASVLVLGGGGLGTALLWTGVGLGLLLAFLLFAYRRTDLLDRLLETDSHEFTVVRVLALTVVVAGAALSFGVSEAVAAFFVGMAVSETDQVTTIESLLEPLRDTFAAIFFFWIGLITDPVLVGSAGAIIALAVLATGPSKLLSGYLGGRIYGLDRRRSTRVALGLTTRGEFSLIIASIALSGAGVGIDQAVAQTIYAFAVGYVLVMSVLGTTLMQYAPALERAVAHRLEPAGAEAPE